jgi:hypothetical protein
MDLLFQVAENEETDEVNFKGSDDSILLARNAEILHALGNTFPTKSLRSEAERLSSIAMDIEKLAPRSSVSSP